MIGLATLSAIAAPWVEKIVPFKWLIIAVAVGGAGFYIDRSARWDEREKCSAVAVQSKLDAALKDLAAEKKARAEDQKALGEIAAEKQKAESDNDKLRDEIKKLPVADQCIIPPDRARRMQ